MFRKNPKMYIYAKNTCPVNGHICIYVKKSGLLLIRAIDTKSTTTQPPKADKQLPGVLPRPQAAVRGGVGGRTLAGARCGCIVGAWRKVYAEGVPRHYYT
jgi:hypothetical protein